MPRARLSLNGDGVYTDKEGRIYTLTQEMKDKIDNIPGVIDNVNSMSTTDALSANMGRELQAQINNLVGALRFLSTWDCTTGLPDTEPVQDPYHYTAGCFYIVSNVGETNYKPHGATYRHGVASTAVETEDVQVNDWYMYDGLVWSLIHNAGGGEIVVDDYLSTTSVNPVQNRVITNALNDKANTSSVLTKTNTTSYTPTQDYHPATKKYVDDNSVAYKAFPPEFDTTHSTSDFLDSIETLHLPVGSTYLGQVSLSDMPEGVYVQAEVEVSVYPQNVIYATMRSAEVSPYIWETNSYDYRGWEPLTGGGGATYTAGENIQISSSNVISATDTTYTASDFDIKDLSDTTHLKETWGEGAALAATALQPGDNITELNNNAEFTVDKVLTQAEYDALGPSTQTDGKRYLIYSTVE